MQYSPDGDRLAVSSAGGNVAVLDATTGKLAYPLLTADDFGVTYAIAFSPDGSVLVTGGQDARIKSWDARTGRALGVLGSPTAGPINALAFSPDGRTLAVAAQESQVLLYEFKTRRVLGEPGSTVNVEPNQLAFDASGELLAIGNTNGTTLLWNLRANAAMGGLLQGTGGVTGLTFSDRNDALVSVSSDGTAAFRRLDIASWREQACAQAGRNLTRSEWTQLIPDRAYHQTCPQWPAGA
jgi:WD40 repeat protein